MAISFTRRLSNFAEANSEQGILDSDAVSRYIQDAHVTIPSLANSLLILSLIFSSGGGDGMMRSIGADTLTESWLSEDSSGEFIASIQEMEKEMKLDPDRYKQVFHSYQSSTITICI